MFRLVLSFLVVIFCLPLFAELPHGIDWHFGSVEKAMSLGKSKNKPLFLYWGAVWCPPCNKIKKMVLSNPKFKNKVKDFIPVYLDGDHPQAQAWGEKLNARSYPTILILHPSGSEITRLPTDISVARYVELMDIVLKNMRTVEQILADLDTAGSSKLSEKDWSVLAGNSWSHIKKNKRIDTLRKLYKHVPAKYSYQKNKIMLGYLSLLAKNKRAPLPADSKQLGKLFLKILKNEKSTLLHFNKIASSGLKIIDKLYQEDPKEKKKVEAIYLAAIRKSLASGKLDVEGRLLAYYPIIRHYKKNLPQNLSQDFLSQVSAVNKETKDTYLRQDVISTAVYLLREAGMYKKAYALALAELKKSPAPYYFMKQLSYISEAKGDVKNVLIWQEKAWKNSKGYSTRFKFGTDYILSLFRLAPANTTKIITACENLFSEILVKTDAFSGRNGSNMKKLSRGIASWEKSYKDQAYKLKSVLKNKCRLAKDRSSCIKKLKNYKLI